MAVSKPTAGLLAAAAGIAVAWLLTEAPVFFGLADYQNVTWLSNDRYDPVLLKIHRPHAQLHGSALGGIFTGTFQIPQSQMSHYQWDLRYDHNGFRNDADLDRADVVFLGASFVEAMAVPDQQITTSLVARQTGTVVANFGQNAFSQQQDLIVLQRYALPLHPRVVIWMFTDYTDLRQVLYYRKLMQDSSGFWPSFFQRSFTRFAYKQVEPYLHPASKPDGTLRWGEVTDARGEPVRIYFLHPGQPLSRETIGAVEATRAILRQALDLSAAQGARLVVVYIPGPYRVFQPFARFAPDSPCRQWVVNDEPQRIEAAARSLSPEVGYLDLTPAMREAVSKGIVPYFTDDLHWSPVGHQLAAAAIAQYLENAGIVSPANGQ
jgi:hypothetical protein